MFVERFSLFDDIHKILYKLGVKIIKLLISVDGSMTNMDEYIIKKVNNVSLSQTLYDVILEKKDEYAYDFPNVMIDLSNH